MGQIQQAAGALAQTALGAAVAGKHLKQQGEQLAAQEKAIQLAEEKEARELPVEIAKMKEDKALLESQKAHEDADKAKVVKESEVDKYNTMHQKMSPQMDALAKQYEQRYQNINPEEAEYAVGDLDGRALRLFKNSGLLDQAKKVSDAETSYAQKKEKAQLSEEQAQKRARQTRDAKIKAMKLSIKASQKRLNEIRGGKK